MEKKRKKTMHELIMEEVNSNPILTEEELKEMMEPESEEEILREEELNEAIFKKVELLEEKLGCPLSDDQFHKIVKEEKIKRKIL